jgi:Fe-S cluster assembly iron-binding protein IscA
MKFAMGIEVTEEAAEVLRRSLELGGVDPASGGVRLRVTKGLGGGVDVQVELADGALEGETTLERAGVRIFLDPEIQNIYPDAIVALEPQHETIVVRPGES